MADDPVRYTDPSGEFIQIIVIGGAIVGGGGIAGMHYSAWRYDKAQKQYLSLPSAQWGPAVQAQYKSYARTTEWIAAGSQVAAYTGTAAVATPVLGYAAGYTWTAGAVPGKMLVGGVAAYGTASLGEDGYGLYCDWYRLDDPERFRRTGVLAGPTLVMGGFGPRYFSLGRAAGAGGGVGPVSGSVRFNPESAAEFLDSPEILPGARSTGAPATGANSRLVPGGGLAAHETAGGHTIARHVGKTDADLAARLTAEPRISGASSFTDRAIAESAIGRTLDANQAAINTWLSGTSPRLVVNHALPESVGRSLARGAAGPVDASGVRVVLQRDPSLPTGYRIVTGFPQ
jgi:hypothetical protein